MEHSEVDNNDESSQKDAVYCKLRMYTI